jgi:hypothetical protein
VGVSGEQRQGGAEQHCRRRIPSASDVSDCTSGQRDRIDLRIEIILSHLDPPEGVVFRASPPGVGPTVQPRGFVGWLGLFAVLQSLIAEPVDQPPP